MATSFQQKALRRKFIYAGTILALFTFSLVFRNYALDPQARALALRERDLGDVELTGSAFRLSLFGMRGLAVSILWMNAIEKQKKQQWGELELLVNYVTKLQPHFVTPWLFQSWNLSYNVAVRCDSERDKYTYIARGIQLLAEGERQNQYQPELRFSEGTYYSMKISNADHKVPLQNLFELSGVDPVRRSPEWFCELDAHGEPLTDRDGRLAKPKLDTDGRPRFETFCLEHPRLVRRLRDKLGYTTQKQVLKYLRQNRDIPSLYSEQVVGDENDRHSRPRTNREAPFPVVPQPRYEANAPPSLEALGGDFDALVAARIWYAYAQEPLPPPDPQVPGASSPITDRIRQRVPEHMTTLYFRGYPGIAQSQVAERLEEEGWFDSSDWKPTGWFRNDRFSNGEPAVVGAGRNWAQDSWSQAHLIWLGHGERNHLLLSPERRSDLTRQAELYRRTYNVQPEALFGPPLRASDLGNREMQESLKAHEILANWRHYVTATNFNHFYFQSEVEAEPTTIAVRKEFFEAETLRLAARAEALEKYEDALKRWADILRAHKELRVDEQIETDSYERQLNYLQLVQDSAQGQVVKQDFFLNSCLGELAGDAPVAAWLALGKAVQPQVVRTPLVVGPLDVLDQDSQPLLDPRVKEQVLIRKGLIKFTPPPPRE